LFDNNVKDFIIRELGSGSKAASKANRSIVKILTKMLSKGAADENL